MTGSSPLAVVVTGAGGGSLGEQVLRALRQARTDYHIVATDISSDSFGRTLADAFEVVPPAADEDYVAALLRLCATHSARVLIPTSEAELRVVSGACQRFAEQRIFVPINRPELIAAGDDKLTALEAVAAAGARTPRHRAIDGVDDLGDWDLFPCVLKPSAASSGSANVFIAQAADELLALADHLLRRGGRLLLEEYVGRADAEFTVAVLRDMDGELIGSIAMQRALLGGLSNRLKVPNRTARAELGDVLAISSGISQGRFDDFPALRGACEELAAALDSRGPLNVQCRWVDNEPVVFEINPRFSGTTSLRALAGFNEPDLLIRLHVLGDKIERGSRYRHGTVMRGLDQAFFGGGD